MRAMGHLRVAPARVLNRHPGVEPQRAGGDAHPVKVEVRGRHRVDEVQHGATAGGLDSRGLAQHAAEIDRQKHPGARYAHRFAEAHLQGEPLALGVDPVRARIARRGEGDAGDVRPVLDLVAGLRRQRRMQRRRDADTVRIRDRRAGLERHAVRRHAHPVGVDVLRQHLVCERHDACLQIGGVRVVRDGPRHAAHLQADRRDPRHRHRAPVGHGHHDPLGRQIVRAVGRHRPHRGLRARAVDDERRKRVGAVRKPGGAAAAALKALPCAQCQAVRGDAHAVRIAVRFGHRVAEPERRRRRLAVVLQHALPIANLHRKRNRPQGARRHGLAERHLQRQRVPRAVDPVRPGSRCRLDADDVGPSDQALRLRIERPLPHDGGRGVEVENDRAPVEGEAVRRHAHPVRVAVLARHRVREGEHFRAGAPRVHGPALDAAHLQAAHFQAERRGPRHRHRLAERHRHRDRLAGQIADPVGGQSAAERQGEWATAVDAVVGERRRADCQPRMATVPTLNGRAAAKHQRAGGNAQPVRVEVPLPHGVVEVQVVLTVHLLASPSVFATPPRSKFRNTPLPAVVTASLNVTLRLGSSPLV